MVNKSDGQYRDSERRRKTDSNRIRKAGLERKKSSTRELNAAAALRHIEEEKRKAQLACLIYFVHEPQKDAYQIIAEVYTDSPEQIGQAAETLTGTFDGLEKKLDQYDASFTTRNFDREVTKICSSRDFVGIELVPDVIERKKDEHYVPVLLVQGPIGRLETLSYFLEDYKTERTQKINLCSVSQPD